MTSPSIRLGGEVRYALFNRQFFIFQSSIFHFEILRHSKTHYFKRQARQSMLAHARHAPPPALKLEVPILHEVVRSLIVHFVVQLEALKPPGARRAADGQDDVDSVRGPRGRVTAKERAVEVRVVMVLDGRIRPGADWPKMSVTLVQDGTARNMPVAVNPEAVARVAC